MSDHARSPADTDKSPATRHPEPDVVPSNLERRPESEISHLVGNRAVQSIAQGAPVLSRVMLAFRAGLGNQVIQRLLARAPVSAESPLGAGSTGIAQREILETVEETFTGRGSRRRTVYYSSLDDSRNPRMFGSKKAAEKYEAELLAKKTTVPTGVGDVGGSSSPKATATLAVPTVTPTKTTSGPTSDPIKTPSTPILVPSSTPAKTPVTPVVTGPTGGARPTAVVGSRPTKQPDRPLSDVNDTVWEQAWIAKQREVQAVLESFTPQFQALDRNAELRIRGSLASGIKGNPSKVDPRTKERLLFNPTDFDVDAYVMSDVLYAQALKESGTSDDVALGKIVGSKLTAVNAIIREMRAALASVTGNRDAPKDDQWRFTVIIRSTRNASSTTGKDRKAMKDLGKPSDWGEPLTINPRDK